MESQQTQTTKDTLLFIPDISGFTKFVNDTEVQHSQHIIEELLEIIIDSNDIGMTMSDIEGDAIFFYREGIAPTAAEILAQVQKMFVNFHSHLKKYENHRICQCGACSTANSLTLKFFGHYGGVSTKQVKDQHKPFGREVILIHRLMKNNINSHEYALFTNPLLNACPNWVNIEYLAWAEPVSAEENYDVGNVKFCYLPLEPLLRHVPEPAPVDYSLPEAKDSMMKTERIIEAPLEVVFDVISDMSFRHKWQDGLVGVDKLSHKITQPGSTHRCVIKRDESDPFFVMHDFKIEKELITFVETNSKDKYSGVYFLRRLGKGLTKVEINYFWKAQVLKNLLFNFFMKKKFLKIIDLSFTNLDAYCKKLVAESRHHTSHIELGFKREG